MNAIRQHIIHRQIIEVDISKGRSVAVLQDRIRNTWYDRLLPALENLLTALAGEEAIIRIDRLTVDLGEVNEEKLEQQLTTKAIDSIRLQLEEKLRFDTAASDDLRVVPIRKADTDILLHFLANGRLPWWSPVKDLDRLAAAIIEGGTPAAGFAERLFAVIAEPAILRRLRFQFPGKFLCFLAARCIPGFDERSEADPAEALAAYSRRKFTDRQAGYDGDWAGAAQADQETSLPAEGLIGKRLDRGSEPPEAGVVSPNKAPDRVPDGAVASEEAHGDENAVDPMEMAAQPGERTPDAGVGSVNGAGLRDVLPGETQTNDAPAGTLLSGAELFTSSDGSTKGLPSEASAEREGCDSGGANSRKKEKQPIDNGAIYIELAGLVILHPFIRPFFDALGLTEERKFKDETSLHKAVHLLGFLATGETDLQEQRLLLPKLFCGMPLTAPIERTGITTEIEIAEAENLLTHTIAHWKALKNSSAAALREGFLLREGKLTQTDNGWQLDVEKKTLDVLMGSMPWGVSVVKFPWMGSLLFVNWG